MRRATLAIVAFIVSSGLACAQSRPDLTGFWERRDVSGSGSFGGIDARIPKAVLVPGAQAAPVETSPNAATANEAPHKAGEPYVVTTGRCGGGMPFMMGHSAAIDIVQTAEEILIIPEMPGTRHIYMDGRSHPPLAAIEPSNVGHSIGRWEGDTLVTDTVGLRPWPIDAFTAGVVRWHSDALHVIERLQYTDPMTVALEMTIDDPKIFTKPWSQNFQMKLHPTWKIYEQVCEENNRCEAGKCRPSDVQKGK